MLLEAARRIAAEKRIELYWKTLVEDGSLQRLRSLREHVPARRSFADGCRIRATKGGPQDCRAGQGGSFLVTSSHDASRCTQCGLCYMSCPARQFGRVGRPVFRQTIPAVAYAIPSMCRYARNAGACSRRSPVVAKMPGLLAFPICSRLGRIAEGRISKRSLPMLFTALCSIPDR